MHLILDSRGKGDMGIRARDGDFAGFQRLAQRIEDGALELRKFVEEQHAKVGHRDLSGPDFQPAAGQRGDGGGVVRGAIGAGAGNAAVLQRPGDRGDYRDFQRFGGG